MTPETTAFLEAFAKCLVGARDHATAATHLASWVSADAFREGVEDQVRAVIGYLPGPPEAADFGLDENPCTASDLRRLRTDLPPQINDQNMVQWACVTLLHSEPGRAWMDLWVAVVREGDALRIGYAKAQDPD